MGPSTAWHSQRRHVHALLHTDHYGTEASTAKHEWCPPGCCPCRGLARSGALAGITGPATTLQVVHSDLGDRREVADHMPTYVELALLARAR